MSTAEDTALPGRGLARRGTLARGALAGICAWLFGYLVAYVWRADAVAEALSGIGFVSRLLGGEAVPTWKGVAWLFLNAQFVATRVPTVVGTRTTNFVTAEGGPTVLLALAPVVLVCAGALVAALRGGTLLERATAGATVALGYFPLSVAAGFGTAHAIGDAGVAISPDPVTATLLAGVVYPVVFGALGGLATLALE